MDNLNTQSNQRSRSKGKSQSVDSSKKIFLGKLPTVGRGKRSVDIPEDLDVKKPISGRSLAIGSPQATKPFLNAAKRGDIQAIKESLAKGVDINAVNEQGETALYLAISRKREDVVLFLLEQEGINVNQCNNKGRSPLHGAASGKNTAITQALLRHPNIDPNIQDENGYTPIHIAIVNNANEAILQIAEHSKFDADIRQKEDSPLYFAEKAQNKIAADMLRPKTSTKDEKQRLIAKMMAIRFSLQKFGFEDGFTHIKTYEELGKNLHKFLSTPFHEETYWHEVKEELIEHMTPLIECWNDPLSINPESIQEKIKNGKPCSIPSGIPEHFIDISISGGESPIVAISNRGLQVRLPRGKRIPSGITYLKISDLKSQFSEAFIQRLLDNDESALQELYTNGETLHIHERISQKRGNCTFAQAKAGFEAHLGFFVAEQSGTSLDNATPEQWKAVLETSDELYQEFTLFDRIEGLLDYAQELDEPDENVFKEAYMQAGRMAERRGDEDGYYKILDVQTPIMQMEQRVYGENLYQA